MFTKVKRFIIVGIASLTLLAPGLVPGIAAYALAPDNVTGGLCTGTNIATNGTTSSTGCTSASANGSISAIASQVVNIFSIIVGVIAVIMIIYGGFKYITSGGDSGNVSGAKNTLIYAVVGLIIVALAQFIVHVVLTTSSSVNTSAQ